MPKYREINFNVTALGTFAMFLKLTLSSHLRNLDILLCELN